MSSPRLVKRGLGMVLLLVILTVVSVAQAPVPEPVTDQETELGQAMYKQLRDKGEIIELFYPRGFLPFMHTCLIIPKLLCQIVPLFVAKAELSILHSS